MKEPQLTILMECVGHTRVNALKGLVKALAGSRLMLIGRSLAFQSAGELRTIAADCFDNCQLVQEGYAPEDLALRGYCLQHDLNWGGCRLPRGGGCHVCQVFHE